MTKPDALKKLEAEIAGADLPLKKEANLVFGEGDPDCSVLFIGEAPGETEDQLRRPFVGRAGKLLDKCIAEIGWRREQVYITNIVKRRPPQNRDPSPEEIEAYKPYLARQIEILNPKVIATLGRFSMNYFLPFAKISRDHGKVFEIDAPPPSAAADGGGTGVPTSRLIFPLYHPAAALRATAVLDDLRSDFKKLPAVVRGEIAPPPSDFPKPDPALFKKKEPPPQQKLF